MVKGLASFWYWDLLRNGIERKNFGLDESWYIALLGQYTHFLVHLYYLIMILILTLPVGMIMILILSTLLEMIMILILTNPS
jgi:hypothetical protein